MAVDDRVPELEGFNGTLAELRAAVDTLIEKYGPDAECSISGEYDFGESAGLIINVPPSPPAPELQE